MGWRGRLTRSGRQKPCEEKEEPWVTAEGQGVSSRPAHTCMVLEALFFKALQPSVSGNALCIYTNQFWFCGVSFVCILYDYYELTLYELTHYL